MSTKIIDGIDTAPYVAVRLEEWKPLEYCDTCQEELLQISKRHEISAGDIAWRGCSVAFVYFFFSR